MQEVSRSNIVGATTGACTLTYGRRLTRNAHSNPKVRLNRRFASVAVIVTGAEPAAFAALAQVAIAQSTPVGMDQVRVGHFLDLGEFVGVDFTLADRKR
jgi:hypothetical protein